MNDILKIEGLCAKIENKDILKGVDLVIKTGEVHAIMGPNGTGKSTLSSVIMGQPKYTVTDGDIKLNDESILELAVDERARRGIFLAYQYPAEVPGVTNSDFIRSAMKATTGKDVPLFSFIRGYDKAIKDRLISMLYRLRYKKKTLKEENLSLCSFGILLISRER